MRRFILFNQLFLSYIHITGEHFSQHITRFYTDFFIFSLFSFTSVACCIKINLQWLQICLRGSENLTDSVLNWSYVNLSWDCSWEQGLHSNTVWCFQETSNIQVLVVAAYHCIHKCYWKRKSWRPAVTPIDQLTALLCFTAFTVVCEWFLWNIKVKPAAIWNWRPCMGFFENFTSSINY